MLWYSSFNETMVMSPKAGFDNSKIRKSIETFEFKDGKITKARKTAKPYKTRNQKMFV